MMQDNRLWLTAPRVGELVVLVVHLKGVVNLGKGHLYLRYFL